MKHNFDHLFTLLLFLRLNWSLLRNSFIIDLSVGGEIEREGEKHPIPSVGLDVSRECTCFRECYFFFLFNFI